MNLAQMTGWQLKKLLADKKTSNREIVQSVIETIEQKESDIQAFITLRDYADLLKEADAIDEKRCKGESIGLLDGLPIAVKDNICTAGLLTTCASKMLANFVPPYDATVIKKIREADGLILGKTNMDEFAMGSSTENSAFHLTHNPHNLEYVPGGTSGGSAAAVAANQTIFAIGSDTGGSIRQPAAFCGVVGMKPTYGRVSRYGLVAYGSSLDQIGTITKSVNDTALLLNVIAGHDPNDSTSLPLPYDGSIEFDLNKDTGEKLRIGVPEEYLGDGLNPEIRRSIEFAIELLQSNGREIVRINLPHTQYGIPTYYILACCEASSNLGRFSGIVYGHSASNATNAHDAIVKSRTQGFGDEVKRRIMLGTYALSAGYYDEYYLRASKVRELIKHDFEQAFKVCDVILHPIAPESAFKIGEKVTDPLKMYLGDVYSIFANLVGLPAITIPCGWDSSGLPIGVQLVSNLLKENILLRISFELEKLLLDSGILTLKMKNDG